MDKNKQKIAIAEACGFDDSDWIWPNGKGSRGESIPDYLNDLNAMHEAIMTLSNRQLDDLHTWISDTMTGTDKYMWLLTPQQYAEAFLRTIGKWDDVE
tara:strand:- start:1982 stop:2275 length:294 start_codon:yes stop_codon:yes gene_type:complete